MCLKQLHFCFFQNNASSPNVKVTISSSVLVWWKVESRWKTYRCRCLGLDFTNSSMVVIANMHWNKKTVICFIIELLLKAERLKSVKAIWMKFIYSHTLFSMLCFDKVSMQNFIQNLKGTFSVFVITSDLNNRSS